MVFSFCVLLSVDVDFLQEHSSLIFKDIHMILSAFLPPVSLTTSSLISMSFYFSIYLWFLKICVFEELFPKIIPYSFPVYPYPPNAPHLIAINEGARILEDICRNSRVHILLVNLVLFSSR
jgi:hypothetical protein